jgi:hypothetical protein
MSVQTAVQVTVRPTPEAHPAALTGAERALEELRHVHADLVAVTEFWERAFSHVAAQQKTRLGIELAAMVHIYSISTDTPEPAVLALLAA